MDFSSIYQQCNIGDNYNFNTSNTNSNSKSSSNSTVVQDFILLFEYVNEHNERIRQYYDFICDNKTCNTNDYYFVNAVWEQLIAMRILNEFDSIDIWSD